MYRLQIFSVLQHLPFQHFVLLVVLVGSEFDLRGVAQPNRSCSKATLQLRDKKSQQLQKK